MPQRGLFTRSDQYSFVQQGVPSIFLVPRRANRDKAPGKRWNHYHKVSDEVELIDFEQLGRFTDVNHAIIRNVANMAEKPVWNAGDFFAKTFGGEMAQ
jgi:Zn-dependent M28 family amino/carboxypeptidase